MTARGKSNKHKIVDCLYIQILCPTYTQHCNCCVCVYYEIQLSSTVVQRFTAAWEHLVNKEASELICLSDLDVPLSLFLRILKKQALKLIQISFTPSLM